MSKKQLLKRIEELEARIVALEARPLFPVVPSPHPWQPLVPWCHPGGQTGDPLPVPFLTISCADTGEADSSGTYTWVDGANVTPTAVTQ